MMAGLLAISQKYAAGRWTMPTPAQLKALPNVIQDWGALGIDDRVDAEPWLDFVQRIDVASPASLARRDLRRLATEIWDHPELSGYVDALFKHCAAISKRTLDRRMARAYWNRFRADDPIFEELAAYCGLKQKELGSPWTELASDIPVWDCKKGPQSLGKHLLGADERNALLARANLRNQDLQGGFVDASFAALLETMATRPVKQQLGAAAQAEGDELMDLSMLLGEGVRKANGGILSYVLLKPWSGSDPDEAYRDQVIEFLLKVMDDPRTASNAWGRVASDLAQAHNLQDAPQVLGILHHWITEKTVRLFFDLIAKTTNRPDQWRERRAFWESYLDQKVVQRAWFALGEDARWLAQSAGATQGLGFGRVRGAGAASSQSVLLMKIGDLLVAEWSDNGRARFWHDVPANAQHLPEFNKKFYEGQKLRSMTGGSGFEAIAHQGRWYRKFADHIRRMTGIAYKGAKPSSLWGW